MHRFILLRSQSLICIGCDKSGMALLTPEGKGQGTRREEGIQGSWVEEGRCSLRLEWTCCRMVHCWTAEQVETGAPSVASALGRSCSRR